MNNKLVNLSLADNELVIFENVQVFNLWLHVDLRNETDSSEVFVNYVFDALLQAERFIVF